MPGTNVDPKTVAGSDENMINESMARWFNIREHKSDLLMADMVQWPSCPAQTFDQSTGLSATPQQIQQGAAATAAPRSPAQVEPTNVGQPSPIGGSDIQTSGTGGVAIQSGQTVQFINKGSFSGKWIITSARFELNDGSLKTTVSFRKCLKPSDYPTLMAAASGSTGG